MLCNCENWEHQYSALELSKFVPHRPNYLQLRTFGENCVETSHLSLMFGPQLLSVHPHAGSKKSFSFQKKKRASAVFRSAVQLKPDAKRPASLNSPWGHATKSNAKVSRRRNTCSIERPLRSALVQMTAIKMELTSCAICRLLRLCRYRFRRLHCYGIFYITLFSLVYLTVNSLNDSDKNNVPDEIPQVPQIFSSVEHTETMAFVSVLEYQQLHFVKKKKEKKTKSIFGKRKQAEQRNVPVSRRNGGLN